MVDITQHFNTWQLWCNTWAELWRVIYLSFRRLEAELEMATVLQFQSLAPLR